MTVARLIAVPWVALQVVTEEAEFVPPVGRGPGLGLCALLLVGGLVIWGMTRRTKQVRCAKCLAIGGLVLDSLVVSGYVALYATQPLSGIWATLYILPLEAATFFALSGALLTWVGTAVLYVGVQVWTAGHSDLVLSWNTIGFQMGIGVIISIIAGLLARSLHREREALERELEERWRAERQLAERHRQLTEAREIARLGAWEWDLEADELTWSEGLFEIHGVEPVAEGSLELFRSMQHPDDRDRVRLALDRAVKERSSFALDYRIVGPSGEIRFLRGKGEAIIGPLGRVTGLIGTIQDITAQRSIEATMHEVNAELQRSVTELQQRNLQATLTASMGEMLLSCMTRDEINAVVSEFGERMFPGSAGELAVTDGSRLERAASWPGERVGPVVADRDACWALRMRRPHVVEAGPSAQRCAHLGADETASICVPLIAQGEVLGVLSIGDRADGRWMHEGPEGIGRRLAQTMAEYVGLALANLNLREELREQSLRDPLTGLFNRRHLVETLERDLQRALRSGEPLTLLAIDVDHFKELNDTDGHAAGDEALRELGAFLAAEIRSGDVACRTGGDEFTVVLAGATLEQATARAEQLRAGARDLVRVSGTWRMGISIGIAGFPPHGIDAESLHQLADEALYRAKRGGRDAVAVAAMPAAPIGALRLAAGE